MNTSLKRMISRAKQTKQNNSDMIRMMLLSFIGIAVCAMLLVGSTFGWFTANVKTAPQRIVAASWTANVNVADSSGTVVAPKNVGTMSVEYSLDCDEAHYTVSVYPIGSGRGYCKLEIGGKTYYTEQIKNDTFEFGLVFTGDSNDVAMTVTACWGVYGGDPDITNQGTLTVKLPVTAQNAAASDELSSQDELTANENPEIESAPVEDTEDTEDTKDTVEDVSGITTPEETTSDTYYEVPEDTSAQDETKDAETDAP